MYQDGRSKRVVCLAHCLLNQNSISDGTAVYPAAFREVVSLFLEANVGIFQLPCPEFCCLGLDRGNPQGAGSPVTVENTRIRRALEADGPSQTLDALADLVMGQLLEYRRNGFEIVGIVGADRSPTCGVETTSDQDQELPGMGLFTERLARRLKEEGLSIPMVGLKSSDDAAAKLRALL